MGSQDVEEVEGPEPGSEEKKKKDEPVRAMKTVHERYDKLRRLVDSLSEKTEGLVEQERQEFMAAYRAHTYKIQLELRSLRRQVAEVKSSSRREDKLKELRADRDWFRDEALGREKQASALSEKLTGLKDRLEMAEDTRGWLVQELTSSKAKVETLKKALDKIKSRERISKEEKRDDDQVAPKEEKSDDDQTQPPVDANTEALMKERDSLRARLADAKALEHARARDLESFRARSERTPHALTLRWAFLRAAETVKQQQIQRTKRTKAALSPKAASLKARSKPHDDDAEPDPAADAPSPGGGQDHLARFAALDVDRFTATDRIRILQAFLADAHVRDVLVGIAKDRQLDIPPHLLSAGGGDSGGASSLRESASEPVLTTTTSK